jgi:hypothetical protein
VYKLEVGEKIDEMIIRQGQDVSFSSYYVRASVCLQSNIIIADQVCGRSKGS